MGRKVNESQNNNIYIYIYDDEMHGGEFIIYFMRTDLFACYIRHIKVHNFESLDWFTILKLEKNE